LSRRAYLQKTISTSVVGLEVNKEQFKEDSYYSRILEKIAIKDHDICAEFVEKDGYLFKGTRFCIPEGSRREYLILELH
jgi:hypothetical protein